MAKTRNIHNQKPHLTQDFILESDINTSKYYIQESQDVCPFLAGVQARQYETQIAKGIHKRSTTFEQSVKINWRA